MWAVKNRYKFFKLKNQTPQYTMVSGNLKFEQQHCLEIAPFQIMLWL